MEEKMKNNAQEIINDSIEQTTDHASLQASIKKSQEISKQIEKNPEKFRVLTGDRPTGNLHLGHYFGTLKNRVEIQNKGVDTWILIADYQVITDRDSLGPIKERVLSLCADYIACGIDPKKSTIFTHSAIPALNQLMLPFLSLVTEAELHRNPTVKSELEATNGRAMSGLLLTYPIHQTADILFCKANLVPVGKDQLPHLEQARVIASRFDKRYGRVGEKPIFPQPQALLSQATLILGLDGQKMSKSKGNTIEIGMDDDTTLKRIKKAVTDSERFITYDPINRPEVSNLLLLASMASGIPAEKLAEEIGNAGAGQLKKVVAESLIEMLTPIRKRRKELMNNKDYLLDVLRQGNEKANEIANQTLKEVKQAMQMIY